MSGVIGTEVKRSTTKSVEWYTPAWIFDILDIEYDLDPSSPVGVETAVPALTKYTMEDDGLLLPWFGKVWLNPPYGPTTEKWMQRMINHGQGIALVFSRTDAKWCQRAMRSANGILFLSGRVDFIPGEENRKKKSRAGAGTVLFSFGEECTVALRRMAHLGTMVALI